MDRAKRVEFQKELILKYAQKLIDAGMTAEGAAVNAANMALAVVLEHTTIPGREGIVEEALKIITRALITYQKKVEPDLDVEAINQAAREMNEELDEAYLEDARSYLDD